MAEKKGADGVEQYWQDKTGQSRWQADRDSERVKTQPLNFRIDVAWVERSEIPEKRGAVFENPGFAALNPGYIDFSCLNSHPHQWVGFDGENICCELNCNKSNAIDGASLRPLPLRPFTLIDLGQCRRNDLGAHTTFLRLATKRCHIASCRAVRGSMYLATLDQLHAE